MKYFIGLLFVALVFINYFTNPTKNQIQARKNLINGHSAECMMDIFFTYGKNWKR